jgi:hypothetical protein
VLHVAPRAQRQVGVLRVLRSVKRRRSRPPVGDMHRGRWMGARRMRVEHVLQSFAAAHVGLLAAQIRLP